MAYHEELWDQRFQEMIEYRKKHGNLLFKRKCDGEEAKLRLWIFTQRKLLRCGKISIRRTALLKAAEFEWKPGIAFESKWDEMYNKLVEFFETNGHLALPARKHELGAWMCRQRVTRRRGKLSQERIDRLNKLPFSWSGTEVEYDKVEHHGWENAHPNQFTKEWHAKLKELIKYKEKFGHFGVHRGYNKSLTQWIFRQRRLYAEGLLCKERVSELNSIGFAWRTRTSNALLPSDERWHQMYKRLKAFKTKHGHFDIASQGCNDSKLTKWVRVQMNSQWTSHAERKAMLEDLGFHFEQCDPAPSLPSTRSTRREQKTPDSVEEHQHQEVKTDAGESHSASARCMVQSGSKLLVEAKHGSELLALRSFSDRPTMKASTRGDSATIKTATERRELPPKTNVSPPQIDSVYPVGAQILNFFPGLGWYKGTVQAVDKDKYTVVYEDGHSGKFLIGGPTLMDAPVEFAKSHPDMGVGFRDAK